METEIKITDPQDSALAAIAEGACVTRTILPSGFQVPDAPAGKSWVIHRAKIVLEDTGDRWQHETA